MKVVLLSWDGRGVDGLDGQVISAPAVLRGAEALRARRGFEPGVLTMSRAERAVRRLRPDLVHAFSLPDAAVAAGTRRPAVLSFPFVPDRSTVASRRGRLALIEAAVQGCHIVAPDAATAEGLARWLGVDAPVVGASAMPALYAELAGR